MKLLSSLALSLSLLPYLSLSTSASNERYLLKESVPLPRGWHRISVANPSHKLQLRIGLLQSGFKDLEQHLFEVSDPDHERYGQHLSKEHVESLVAPEAASLHVVDRWLASHGLTESNITRSPAKDWIYVTVPVRLAEQMLNTTYHLWQHSDSGQYIVRTTSYNLPSRIFDHIDVIQPTTIFSRWQAMRSAIYWPGSTGLRPFSRKKSKSGTPSPPVVDPSCTEIVTVKCLSQLYRTLGYVPRATKKNGIGITGYLEQFANYEDLRSFFTAQLPQAVNLTYTFHSVKGGLNNQTLEEAGIEAGLDTQYAFGLAFPTPGTFWSTGGRAVAIPDAVHDGTDNEPFADWIDFVLKQRNIPQSISTSYAEHEQTVPESYARRVCAGLAQLGARGVTLTFASGDLGVGDGNPDPETQLCFTNDGKNTTRFLSMFPASCPYVTAVGGTYSIPEVGVPFSGGGFSDYFPQPDYQVSAVNKYLAQLPEGKYEGLYNKKGRAVPDISAQSWLYQSWWKGEPFILGGTSASSPTVAAIVALLNDARLAKGLPTLGFLNPLLYSKGMKGINDIVEGNNPGCGTTGFEALPGWDPVTGLGTPDFIKLKGLVT